MLPFGTGPETNGEFVPDAASAHDRDVFDATLAEVERCTRRGATINVFMLDDDPRLIAFMQELGKRNGGRVFLPKAGALGEYVVADYLRARHGRRRRQAG